MLAQPFGTTSLDAEPRNVFVRLCSAVEGIQSVLQKHEMLTPPYPPMGPNAFLVLNCLAQVRAQLLDKDYEQGEKNQGVLIAERLVLLQCRFEEVSRAAGLSEAQIPQLKAAQATIFAPEPFQGMSTCANNTYRDPDYCEAVRERLIELIKLELAVMKYLTESPRATEPNASNGE